MTEVDLTGYVGQSVQVHFRLGVLNGTGTGWWIDQVSLRSVFVGCDISACGIPGDCRITSVSRDGEDTVLEWWDDPVAARYQVYRSYDPSAAEHFDDVTALDDDDTDRIFRDPSDAGFARWIVQGIGPDGDGP